MDGCLNLTCQVCGNTDFDDGSTDGFFYCLSCGTRAEDIISTGTTGCDAGDGTFDCDTYFVNGFRRTKANKANPNLSQFSAPFTEDEEPKEPSDFGSRVHSAKNLSYDDYYTEVRKRYLMSVQIMLQMQSQALVDEFKVNRLVPEFAATVWLRFVAGSKVFSDTWAEDSICESESQSRREINDFETRKKHNRYGSGPVNIFGKPAVICWYSSLKRKIPLSSSLIISFLACHLAREPILASDILEWALAGKIPYFDAFTEIEKKLGPPSLAFPLSTQSLCRPSRLVQLEKMESGAASIAESIGLLLPPVNFHAIASRFLSRLSLPRDEIFPSVCRIYEWVMPPDLYFSTNPSRLPTHVCVMSVIIVAVRCVYKLHGFGLSEENMSRVTDSASTNQGGAPSEGAEVVEGLARSHAKTGEIPENFEELSGYLKYCEDVVFAGLGPSFDDQGEEIAINKLHDFYSRRKRDDEFSLMDSGDLVGICESKSMEDKIWDLKEEMGENLFNYIPPRKRLKRDGYLHYCRKGDDGYFAYVAHSDYYRLLSSAARVAKVDPRVMHIGALRLEKRLAWIEKQVGRLLSECGSESDHPPEKSNDDS